MSAGSGEIWTLLGPIPVLLAQLLWGDLPGTHTVLLLLVACPWLPPSFSDSVTFLFPSRKTQYFLLAHSWDLGMVRE